MKKNNTPFYFSKKREWIYIPQGMLLLLLILLLSACTTQASPQATPTPQPSQTQTRTPSTTPTITSTPEPSFTPSSTPLTGGTLNEEGPWLMYEHEDKSMYFINPDGTGKTSLPINTKDLLLTYTKSSENNNLISIFTYRDPEKSSEKLYIVSLPDLKILQDISTGSYLFTHSMEEEEKYSVMPSGNFWSPDGKFLAFTAMIDGPSNDMYSYDVASNEIHHITTGENEISGFFWSPDSQWIVHQETAGYGMGDTYVYALWAVSPDGSEIKWLYQPVHHYPQKLLGWLDNARFVTINTSMMGSEYPRVTNVQTGESNVLYNGMVLSEDIGLDIENEVLAFYPVGEGPLKDEESGIYLLSITSPYPQFVTNDHLLDINDCFDEEIGYFITFTDCRDEEKEAGVIGFASDGILKCVHPTPDSSGKLSPDEQWVFTYITHKICSTADEKKCIFTLGNEFIRMVWSSDSKGFFAFTRENLYYISLDSLTPVLIDNKLGYSDSNHGIRTTLWVGSQENHEE